MKTLCLIRHAKSTWGALGTDDIDRPLHPTGEANAPLMGEVILKRGIKPDLIITSNALRAKTTAELLAAALRYDKEKIEINNNLYDASVDDIIQILETTDDKVKTLLLVGHNPGLTLLANYLAEENVSNLPTCGTFCIDIKTKSWRGITEAETKVKFIDEPTNH